MSDSFTVLHGPVRFNGIIVRLIELPDGSGRIEAWNGVSWVPGGGEAKKVRDVAQILRSPNLPEPIPDHGDEWFEDSILRALDTHNRKREEAAKIAPAQSEPRQPNNPLA